MFCRNESLKNLEGLVDLTSHKVTLAQRGEQVGPLRRNRKARLQQWDRVFEIVLRDADLGHQVNDVRILRRNLVRPHQKVKCVQRPPLIVERLRLQKQSLR